MQGILFLDNFSQIYFSYVKLLLPVFKIFLSPLFGYLHFFLQFRCNLLFILPLIPHSYLVWLLGTAIAPHTQHLICSIVVSSYSLFLIYKLLNSLVSTFTYSPIFIKCLPWTRNHSNE